jgi:hypothetical protein
MKTKLPVLNAGEAKIARSLGRVEGRDFIMRHDWPQGLSDLRWTGDGWQRRTDPRYFPCCERDHAEES